NVAELKDMVRALLLDKKNQYSAQTSSPTHASIKAVEPNCVTRGDNHAYQNCPETSGNVYQDNIQEYVSQAAVANYGQGNTDFSPQMVANQIRPPGFPPVQNTQNNFNRRNNFNQNRGSGTLLGNTVANPKEDLKGNKGSSANFKPQSAAPVQPTVTQSEPETPVSEPVVAPVSAPMPNFKPLIPYPSRHDNERRRDQANEQIEKLYKIFKEMSFEINFTDALMLMPKFASTMKALIGNKEKLSEMARTPMNEHCSVVILNKLPKKLGDPEKFLLPGNTVTNPKEDLKGITTRSGVAYKGPTIPTPSKVVKPEVLGFSDVTASGSPTPSDDPVVSTTSPVLTLFGDSDFLLFEEADAFLGLEDDPDSPELDPSYYDPEGEILSLEVILNSDPSPPFPNHEQSVPSFKEQLKACEAKTIKSSIDEPPKVELKDLPPS
nr:reverse transcriptase domain-containing protein [Tanacetum cinerariifolium]